MIIRKRTIIFAQDDKYESVATGPAGGPTNNYLPAPGSLDRTCD
jgi:hypothetical protein